MRGAPRGVRRSVDRGTHRPAIEPRKSASGCRRRRDSGRQHGGRRQREPPDDPARSETLACAHAPCAGTGRSRGWPPAGAVWSASGRHCAVADDVRPREVGPCRSSEEPRERGRATVGGGRGAKDQGRGEHDPDRHAPDPAPDPRVPRAGACTESFAVIHPRWEPGAGMPHAGFCAGGVG